jgi:hypothetical protein
MTKDEPQYDLATELSRTDPYGACKERWNALSPEVKERLFRLRLELSQHQMHGRLPEERVRQHVEVLQNYLG